MAQASSRSNISNRRRAPAKETGARKVHPSAKIDPIFAVIAAYKEALAVWHKASAAEKSLRSRLPADIIDVRPFILNNSYAFKGPLDIDEHVNHSIAIESRRFGPVACRRMQRIAGTARAELRRIFDAHQSALKKRQTAAGWTAATERLNDAYLAVYASKWKLVKTVPTSHDGLLAMIAQIREPGPHMASTNEYFLSTLEKAVVRINRASLLRSAYLHGRIDGGAR